MLSVDRLMIEVTRNCNMRCEHCLRGDAQRKSVSKSVIRELNSTFQISRLMFGGGEISSSPAGMQAVVENMTLSPYGAVWFSTNGKRVSSLFKDFVRWLKDFNSELCIQISRDRFHDPLPATEIWKLKDFAECMDIETYEAGKNLDYSNLIAVGRAEHTGGRPVKVDRPDPESEYDIDFLYVSYDGRLFVSCDLSYEMMDDPECEYVLDRTIFDSEEEILESYKRYFNEVEA